MYQTQETIATDSQRRANATAPSSARYVGRLRKADADDELAIDELPIPKKRKWPRRSDDAEAKRPVQINEVSEEPLQKRRTGRPRFTGNTPPPTPSPFPPLPPPAPAVKQAPVAKKRGRPRKVTVNSEGDAAALSTPPTTPSSLVRTSGIDLVPLGARSRSISMSGGRYVASGNRTAAHALPLSVPMVRPARLSQFQGAQSVPAASVVNVAKVTPRKTSISAVNAAKQQPTKPMQAHATRAAPAPTTQQQLSQTATPRTSNSASIVTSRRTLPSMSYSAPISTSMAAPMPTATQISASSTIRPSISQTAISRSADPRQSNGIRTISASDYLRSNRNAGESAWNPSAPLSISPPTSPSPAAVIPQWPFELKKPATFLRSHDFNQTNNKGQPYDIEAALKGRRRIHPPLPRLPEPLERARSDDLFSSSSRPSEREARSRAENPFSSSSRAPHHPVDRPPPQTGWNDSLDGYSSRDRPEVLEDNHSFEYAQEETHSRRSWRDAPEPSQLQAWRPPPREESTRPYSYESSSALYRDSPRTSPPVQESYRKHSRQSFLPAQETRNERSSEHPEDSYPSFSSHDPLLENLISRMASFLPNALLPVLNKTKKARKMRFYVDYVNRVEVICGKDVVKVKIETSRGTVLVSGREWLVVYGSSSVDVYKQILEQLLDDSKTWRKLIEDAKRMVSTARNTIGSHADPGISFTRLWNGIKRTPHEFSLERQVIYFCGDQRHHWSFVIGKVEIGSGSDVDRKRAYNLAAKNAMSFLNRLRIMPPDQKYGPRERELERRFANEEYARRPRVDDFDRSERPPRPKDREEKDQRPTQIPAASVPPVSIVHAESWTSPDASFSPIVRSDPSDDMSISESESGKHSFSEWFVLSICTDV